VSIPSALSGHGEDRRQDTFHHIGPRRAYAHSVIERRSSRSLYFSPMRYDGSSMCDAVCFFALRNWTNSSLRLSL